MPRRPVYAVSEVIMPLGEASADAALRVEGRVERVLAGDVDDLQQYAVDECNARVADFERRIDASQ